MTWTLAKGASSSSRCSSDLAGARKPRIGRKLPLLGGLWGLFAAAWHVCLANVLRAAPHQLHQALEPLQAHLHALRPSNKAAAAATRRRRRRSSDSALTRMWCHFRSVTLPMKRLLPLVCVCLVRTCVWACVYLATEDVFHRVAFSLRSCSLLPGDATQCSKCKAVLSVLSTLTDHTGAVIASPTDAEAAEATAADTADTTATPVEEERQLRTVPEEDAEPAQDTPTTTATTTATATTNEAADAVVPPPAAAAAASAAAAAAAAAADTPAEEEARQVRTTPHDAEGPAETPVSDRTPQAAPELSATAAAAAPAARSTVVAASTGAAAAESSGTGAGAGAGAGEGAGEGAGAGAGAGAGVGAGAGAGAGSGSSDTTSPPTVEEGDQLWTCEFCGTHNVVTLDNEEIPTQGCLDYIVEPAPAAMSKSESESIIVFCIDVSGSMCVSQPVQGNFKLRYVPAVCCERR